MANSYGPARDYVTTRGAENLDYEDNGIIYDREILERDLRGERSRVNANLGVAPRWPSSGGA